MRSKVVEVNISSCGMKCTNYGEGIREIKESIEFPNKICKQYRIINVKKILYTEDTDSLDV